MTDNEIIKALECCKVEFENCEKCPYGGIDCLTEKGESLVMRDALDLINRQKEQIKKLENIEHFATKTIEKQEKEIEKQQYILMGVMHSVDKWLDGDELKQDEVNRAATMREKTLQITEKQQEQIKRLENIEHFATKTIEKQSAEIERLAKENIGLKYDLQVASEESLNVVTEGIKEFAEELSLDIQRHLMPNVGDDGTVTVENAERYFLSRIKKMTEGSK